MDVEAPQGIHDVLSALLAGIANGYYISLKIFFSMSLKKKSKRESEFLSFFCLLFCRESSAATKASPINHDVGPFKQP